MADQSVKIKIMQSDGTIQDHSLVPRQGETVADLVDRAEEQLDENKKRKGERYLLLEQDDDGMGSHIWRQVKQLIQKGGGTVNVEVAADGGGPNGDLMELFGLEINLVRKRPKISDQDE